MQQKLERRFGLSSSVKSLLKQTRLPFSACPVLGFPGQLLPLSCLTPSVCLVLEEDRYPDNVTSEKKDVVFREHENFVKLLALRFLL